MMDAATTAFDPVAASKRLLRAGRDAALGTLDRAAGFPYASLVTVATDADGSPLLLLSELARHTQNLHADPRGSVLIAARAKGDPLTGSRVSIWGRLAPTDDPNARARFLARQPEAAGYAGFKDFAIWRLEIEGAHLVAGFGRIHDIPAAQLKTDLTGAEALVAAEAGITEHMNEDHADATALYATRLLGAPDGAWRFEGCDPEGFEIGLDGAALRLEFPERAATPGEVRNALVAMVAEARARG